MADVQPIISVVCLNKIKLWKDTCPIKVQLTPEIFFRSTYAPSCPEYLCEKIIEIDKIRAFLQPFEVQHS